MISVEPLSEEPGVLTRLQRDCDDRGLSLLGAELQSLSGFIAEDLRLVEAELRGVDLPDDRVGLSAGHLINLGGKRLRPLCVALGARLGHGFSRAAMDLAIAVELVHSATLLHDDVVDLGDQRRGRTASRMIYGNAASIFAGDWLLIEALRRVRRAQTPKTLDRLLEVIEIMIAAEAQQLSHRAQLDVDRKRYFEIIEGKTASLFSWAMEAGGIAGGLEPAECHALERYGHHLGLAFQVIDDTLDFTGASKKTGKTLFGDLREGKVTYPVIVGMERSPKLKGWLQQIVEAPEGEPVPSALSKDVLDLLVDTGAIDDSLKLARELSDEAVGSLAPLRHHPAKTALVTIAQAAVERQH